MRPLTVGLEIHTSCKQMVAAEAGGVKSGYEQ